MVNKIATSGISYLKEVDENPPNPSALIEGLRSFGYTISTAVADLIDNSITAKAKNIPNKKLNCFMQPTINFLKRY